MESAASAPFERCPLSVEEVALCGQVLALLRGRLPRERALSLFSLRFVWGETELLQRERKVLSAELNKLRKWLC